MRPIRYGTRAGGEGQEKYQERGGGIRYQETGTALNQAQDYLISRLNTRRKNLGINSEIFLSRVTMVGIVRVWIEMELFDGTTIILREPTRPSRLILMPTLLRLLLLLMILILLLLMLLWEVYPPPPPCHTHKSPQGCHVAPHCTAPKITCI